VIIAWRVFRGACGLGRLFDDIVGIDERMIVFCVLFYPHVFQAAMFDEFVLPVISINTASSKSFVTCLLGDDFSVVIPS
jgi:hypothetical protein